VSTDSFVIDVAPELSVVWGVGDLNFFTREHHSVRRELEFAGVHLEKFEVSDDSLSIDDDAPHLWGVAIPFLERVDTSAQVSDVLMQFG
jgi:hypothetical protein